MLIYSILNQINPRLKLLASALLNNGTVAVIKFGH
jgi:hypothetical protein